MTLATIPTNLLGLTPQTPIREAVGTAIGKAWAHHKPRAAGLTDELTGWIEARIRDERQPNLDLATTRQLLDEIAARTDTHQEIPHPLESKQSWWA